MEEIRTFGDILDEIIDLAKLASTPEVRTSMKRKVNTAYQELCQEEPYKWTGVTRPLVLQGTYGDGTVSVTQNSDLVVGTDTAWTENDHLFCKIRIAGSQTPLKIIRVDETAQELTLDAPWTPANSSLASYSIYKDEYGLFPDCEDIRTLKIPGAYTQPVPCGPIEMDQRRARTPFRSGVPSRYTINGHAHYHQVTWADFRIDFDFWEDEFSDEPKNKNLIIFPAIFAQNTVAQVRYTKTVYPMDAETDEPLIPMGRRGVLVYKTLMTNFLKNRDDRTAYAWGREYEHSKKKLAADIETTDDELVVYSDNRSNSFESFYTSDLTTPPWER